MNNKLSSLKVPSKPPGLHKYYVAGVLFLILILYFGKAAVESEKHEVLTEAASTLTTAAVSKGEQLDDWANDCLDEIATATHSPGIFPKLESILRGTSSLIETTEFTKFILPIAEIHKFTWFMLISPDGKIMYKQKAETLSGREQEVIGSPGLFTEERAVRLLRLNDSSLNIAFYHALKKNGILLGYSVAGVNADNQLTEILHSSKLLSLPIDYILYTKKNGDKVVHPDINKQHDIATETLNEIDLSKTPASTNAEAKSGEAGNDFHFITVKNLPGDEVFVVPHHVLNSDMWLLTITPADYVERKMNERATYTIVMVVLIGFIMFGMLLISALAERRSYTQTMLYNVQERAALEEHYKYLIKYANDIIFLLNAQSKILEMNDRATESYLYSRDELTGKPITILLPLNSGEAIPVDYTMSTGRFRTTHRKKDGSTFPAEVSIRRFSVNEEIYLQLIIRDITEWTAYEKTIKESEERFRLLADNVNDIIYKIHLQPELRFEFISKSMTKVAGYLPEDFYSDPSLCFRIVYPDDLEKFQQTLANPSGPLEIRWFTKSGSVIWTEQLLSITYNENNEAIAIQGISRDITERRNAEIEQERLNRLKTLKGSVNEALLFSQTEDDLFNSVCEASARCEDFLAASVITFENDSALREVAEYGKTIRSTVELPEEEARRLINDIVQNDIPAIQHLAINQHKLLFHTAGMAESPYSVSGYLRFLLFPLSSGSKLSGLFCLLFRAEDDLNHESVALLEETSRNISIRLDYLRLEQQRRQSDLELIKLNRQLKALTGRLEELREDERISLSRQLHDELGQSLTALKIDLTLLQKQNGKGSAAHTQKTMDLLNNIINSVRNISAELRPELLTQLGLLSAIHSHSKEMQRRTGINISVLGDFGDIEDLEIETTFYRVYQEMLTNVVKHATARNVQVTLHNDETKFVLTVEDDGIGFNYNSENPILSLGIIGMRERLARHKGKLVINSSPGEGSIITAVIPLTAEA